jgi:nanoRNase/pAp phosphatase (c-di-AMP/oligoRNAs hydrolase)
MNPELLTRTRAALAKLKETLPAKGRVLIVPHDHPDPDALASAAAMELLLVRHFGLRGQIVFSGTVSRAENRELLKHFKYTWRLLSQLREPRKPLPCIFVDTAPWSGNVTVPRFGRPVAVIDHHPLSRKKVLKGVFTDIRAGMGATAAIMTEYLVATETSVPPWLSSIMAYAIASETLDLSQGTTERDLEAYTRLLQGANLAVLGRIRHAPLSRDYYAHLQEAMQHGRTYGRTAWTHLGCVEKPELVAEVADLLLRMERVTWAFCTAFSENRLIVSLRSSQKGARCGRLLRRVLARGGTGGGHHRMAAGYLELGKASPEERERRRQELVRGILTKVEVRSTQSEEPLELLAQPLVAVNGGGTGPPITA